MNTQTNNIQTGETDASHLTNIRLKPNFEWKTVEVNGENVEIPVEWTLSSPFEEKFQIKTGKKNANDGDVNGTYPFFTCSTETKLKISSYSFDTEALLVNGNGDVGFVKYYKGKFDAYQRVYVIDQINQNIQYMRIYFQKNFKNNLTIQGGAMPYIKVDEIQQFIFKKPPIKEQTLIAQTLTAQEEYIDTLKKQASVERNRLSWLTDELLSGRIRVKEDHNGQPTVLTRDEQGQVVDSFPAVSLVANTEWKTVEVNGEEIVIPQEWDVKKIGDITNCLDNIRKPLSQKERALKRGNIPYWGANCIVDYINEYMFDGKCILLGEDAAPFFDKSKKVSFVVSGKIWPNNHIHILQTNEDYNYLSLKLNDFDYSKVLNTRERPKLTQGTMNKMEISLPPLSEQTLIAQILTTQEEYISAIEQMIVVEEKRLEWLTDELLSGRILIEEVE